MTYPVRYRNNTIVAGLLRGSQFLQNGLDVASPPRAPVGYTPGPTDRAVQWRGRSGLPMVPRPPRVPPRVGNYIGPAARFIRQRSTVLARLSPIGRVWQAYQLARSWYNYADVDAQRHASPVMRSLGSYTEVETCCAQPISGVSRNFLWVFCDGVPCTLTPGGGAIDGDIRNPDGSNPFQLGSWWTDGSLYSTGALNVAKRTRWVLGFADLGPMEWASWLSSPGELNAVSPSIDPFVKPGTPVASPGASPARWMIPYRRLNPNRSPHEQASWGNSVAGPPVAGRDIGLTVSAGSGGDTGVTQGGHENARPGPGKKEAKVRLAHPGWSRGLGVARAVVYGGTEFADAVHAVWGAVSAADRRSSGCQGSGAVTCRAVWIFNHMDRVNWPKAVLRLVANHFVDEVIGRANGVASRQGTRLGIRTSAVSSASGGGVAGGVF